MRRIVTCSKGTEQFSYVSQLYATYSVLIDNIALKLLIEACMQTTLLHELGDVDMRPSAPLG